LSDREDYEIYAQTPLASAAQSGDVEAVRALLADGVDQSPNAYWALRLAAARLDAEVLKLLLDAGADLRGTLTTSQYRYVEYQPGEHNSLTNDDPPQAVGGRLLIAMMVALEKISWAQLDEPPEALALFSTVAKGCAAL